MANKRKKRGQEESKDGTLKYEDSKSSSTGSEKEKHTDKSKTEEKQPENKEHGSLLTSRRIVLRLVFVAATVILARFYYAPQTEGATLASVGETVSQKVMEVSCSSDYVEDLKNFPECTPKKCGRVVMDGIVSRNEVAELLGLAKRGFAHGGSNGGASILDLHSGALSSGSRFVNIFAVLGSDQKTFTEDDFRLYKTVRTKIHRAIARYFGISTKTLYLTHPTFFSRMNSKPARTVHDEYWHDHVDKTTYGSFDYTTLLYLSEYSEDFTGGRFVFVDTYRNITVEPKAGRLSFFTSGSENLHHVEPVEGGTRYAITVSFTCDPEKAIKDPVMRSQ